MSDHAGAAGEVVAVDAETQEPRHRRGEHGHGGGVVTSLLLCSRHLSALLCVLEEPVIHQLQKVVSIPTRPLLASGSGR
jgi:hypothetical protein